MNANSRTKLLLRHLTCAAMCLALCLYLPFLTGQIPQIGRALSPMHIPVLLAGFLCGNQAAQGSVFKKPAFCRLITNTGIKIMCTMIPGTALVKAPAMKAAQPNSEPVTPLMIVMAMPQTIRPPSMAKISDT